MDSKWTRALDALVKDTLLITPRALAAAARGGGEVTEHDVSLASTHLSWLASQGKLVRLEKGWYALPDRLAEHEALGDAVVARLKAAGWQGMVDVWRAYLLMHASPDVRERLWRDPRRGLLIQKMPDYSPRAREALVLALWQAARKGALTRLRKGVYALPGQLEPVPDPFALSLKMRDPLITPSRAHLLIAHWLGLLDDGQVAELWDEDSAHVCGALRMVRFRVKNALHRARRSGLLVRVARGQYIHHSASGGRVRRALPRASAWRRALKRVLSNSDVVTAEALARAYLDLSNTGEANFSRARMVARAFLGRMLRNGDLVRVGWGQYMPPERAPSPAPTICRDNWRGAEALMAELERFGWRGAIESSRAYLLLYAPPDARAALWRRPDRELAIRHLDGYSPLHLQYARNALSQAARLGWLIRLRKGVYALPGTIQPEPDMAALSLRMPDPLVTPQRARLLYAYWLGLLDEDQVAELWDAGEGQISALLGSLRAERYRYLERALARGCLVKLGRGRYAHPRSGIARA